MYRLTLLQSDRIIFFYNNQFLTKKFHKKTNQRNVDQNFRLPIYFAIDANEDLARPRGS